MNIIRLQSSARRVVLVAGIILFGSMASMCPAHAQIGSDRYSSVIIDAGSGAVLSAVNPDGPRYPASLTKMMTLYMTFEALRDRRLTLDQDVPVSAHAASMSPSKLGLLPGARLSVEQAILGLVTKSANDAAAALGELLGGDEERFAQMMTLRARALGMRDTTFRNASGLPDPAQISTARDLATLGRHLVQDFPVQYGYFSVPSFRFRGRVIFNHDRMLVSYPGADGIKTGFTEAAGHNLVTSAIRGNVRLVGVVLGAASNAERDQHMAALLDQGFEQMDVPVSPHRDVPMASRIPNLLAVAQAATVPATLAAPASVRPSSLRISDLAHGRARVQPVPPRWGVQVGTFKTEAMARRAASSAAQLVDAGDAHVEAFGSRKHLQWRAQLVGMTQTEAQAGCSVMARHRQVCAVLRAASGQYASR